MRTDIYGELNRALPGDAIQLPLFGRSLIRDVCDHDTRSSTFVRSWDLETQLGQTIQIKRYDRGKGGRPRWIGLPDHGGRGARTNPSTTDPKTALPPAAPAEKRRAGLVRAVADLDQAARFYESFAGLRRERRSETYVSFGWLALELSEAPETRAQLSLPDEEELAGSRQAIRVYVEASSIAERHRQITDGGHRVGPLQDPGGAARFRCSDPDGYVVEFRARTGQPR